MADPYEPRAELYKAFPKMKELSRTANSTMEAAVGELARRELAGQDTSFARAALDAAEWRIKCTSDDIAASVALDRLKKMLNPSR